MRGGAGADRRVSPATGFGSGAAGATITSYPCSRARVMSGGKGRTSSGPGVRRATPGDGDSLRLRLRDFAVELNYFHAPAR